MKYSRKNRRYADVLAEIHDSFTEEEYYDSLYYILGDSYPDASDEELEEIFEEMLENMSEQQAEDFMSSLGSIGKKIGSGLAQVPNFLGKNPELLSTIGGIAGNLILPGAGGMIGGALGSAAGGLMQNKNAQNNLQQQQQQNPNAIVNPDAAKLNSLMQDPQMQRALMQMSTSNVPIAPLTSNGQTTHVPIANFLHALIRQVQAALQQLDALIPPQVQEALAENFGEDFAGEDLGEALLEEVRVNGGFEEELNSSSIIQEKKQILEALEVLKTLEGPLYQTEFGTFTEQPLNNPNYSVSFGSNQRFPNNTENNGADRMLIEMFMLLMPGDSVSFETMDKARKTFLWDIHNCWRNKTFIYQQSFNNMNFVRIDPRYTVASPSDARNGQIYSLEFLWFKKRINEQKTQFIDISNHTSYNEFGNELFGGNQKPQYLNVSNVIDEDLLDNAATSPSTTNTSSTANANWLAGNHYISGWVQNPEWMREYYHRVCIYPFDHGTPIFPDRYPTLNNKFVLGYVPSSAKRNLFRNENVLVVDNRFTRNSFIRPGVSIGRTPIIRPLLPWRLLRARARFGANRQISWSRRQGVIYLQTLANDQSILYGETTHTFAHELGHMLGLSDRYHFVINYGAAQSVDGQNFLTVIIPTVISGIPMMEWINIEKAETSVIPTVSQELEHTTLYKFNNGRIRNLMAVPDNIKQPSLSSYQLNVIANHWHEVQLDQAVIMLLQNQNIVIQGIDMSTNPPTYTTDGINSLSMQDSNALGYIANPQNTQPNEQQSPLRRISPQDLLFGLRGANTLQTGLNNGLINASALSQNQDDFSATNIIANFGIRMNPTAATIWDAIGGQVPFATIPATDTQPTQVIMRNIYPNRTQIANILP